jgi:hypothetical protein
MVLFDGTTFLALDDIPNFKGLIITTRDKVAILRTLVEDASFFHTLVFENHLLD